MRLKYLSFLAIVILSAVLLVSCTESDTSSRIENDDLVALDPIMKSKGDLQISVDPRIELLVSVQLQSDYVRLNNQDSKYGKEMKSFFTNFKNHSAVKSFKIMSNVGFSYDAPPTACLYFDHPLTLKQHTPFTQDLIQRAGGENKLEDFFDSLQNFAVKSHFEDFYNEHRELYEAMVSRVYENLGDMDLIKDLEDYYHIQKDEYNIILSPLLHGGGYGPQVETADGKTKIYGILGPNHIDNDGIPVFSTEFIQSLVWHEFSHSFINPLTEKYWSDIIKYNSLFKPISSQMSAMAYGNWETCVNEHIVRAVTARLTYLQIGEDEGNSVIRNERINGFAYIEPLCERLELYEQNPDKWSSFEDFYPELISVFKELSESNLGEDFYNVQFQGPINAAFSDKEKVVLIVPGNESENEMNAGIQQYVTKEIRDRFFPDSEIFTDEEALQKDLSNKMIIAYGTISGNKWLAKYSSQFPFTIEADRVIADDIYEGDDLKLISALPNPQNPDNGLVVYTAQKPQDIIGINSIYHGPTDYVVFSESQDILSSGNYAKTENGWSFPGKKTP